MTTRPTALTAEAVVTDFGPWLYKIIRSFHIHDMEDSDLFNEIVLAFITPSKKLATTYLERYDPSKGAVTTYLYFYASQILKAQLRHCKKRTKLHAYGGTDGGTLSARKHEETLSPTGEEYRREVTADRVGSEARDIFDNLEHDELICVLRSKGAFASRSPSGRPRSSRRVAIAILADRDVAEIAKSLGASTQTVRDKLHALSDDTTIQAIAEDRGLKPRAK